MFIVETVGQSYGVTGMCRWPMLQLQSEHANISVHMGTAREPKCGTLKQISPLWLSTLKPVLNIISVNSVGKWVSA
jgi:hypothetical protein